ncbi:DUF5107 domain-containing protein [Paenibacillus sp. strain BS8-2]
MALYPSTLRINGATLEGFNPLPMFRNRNWHRKVPDNGTLLPEHRDKLGYQTGERYLPYRVQDRYSRQLAPLELETIVLENDKLRATFLPQYGGRLYALYDKVQERDILYTNPVLRPGNLAILNAWFSGGIEWNIGQLGHTFGTCSPIHAAKLTDADGNAFLRMYDYERCKNVFWHLDFHLPPGSNELLLHVRIVNDNSESVPMYWWTNIAAKETPQARVFSGTDEVIYIDHSIKGFGRGKLPVLPTVSEADVSYPMNFPFSNEYFFQTPDDDVSPWEAVAYEDGSMFYERSTSLLRYRKMFCWGNHPGGRRWCDFLSEPGEGNYLEIQGGFAPTQLHGLDMPAGSEWTFTQAFGMTDVDASRAIGPEWQEANRYAQGQVDSRLSAEMLLLLHEKLTDESAKVPEEILFQGSNWGALELRRRTRLDQRGIPQGFAFPLLAQNGDNEETEDWLTLLEEGKMPEREPGQLPQAWMVQDEWLELLSSSLATTANRSWNAYLHLGVMLYERGREDEALAAWKTSLELQPSVWAYRNLAEAMRIGGNPSEALHYWQSALALAPTLPDQALSEEYIRLLIEDKQYEEAWAFYTLLPEKQKAADRIQIIVGSAALELDKEAFINRLFLQEFAVIREGELLIIDLWYGYHARKLAKDRGESFSDQHLEEARASFPPPNNIDFRVIGE